MRLWLLIMSTRGNSFKILINHINVTVFARADHTLIDHILLLCVLWYIQPNM